MDLLAYDPASGYARLYKDQFAQEAGAFFDAAVSGGKVDPELNAQLAAQLRKLRERKEHCSGKRGWWIFLLVLVILLIAVWGICIVCNAELRSPAHLGVFFIAGTACCVWICKQMIPAIKKLAAQEALLQAQIDELYTRIRELLSPLFDFFDWNTLAKLISKVLPPLQFDDFLSLERIADFRDNFGFSLEDEPESTLTNAQSGTFYGYPFVLTEDLDFAWGEKVWTGSLTITYRERITNVEGKSEWVTRSQVLTASITRPCPEFTRTRNFFFGHDAAPGLVFSRTPSSLSGGSGFWNKLGKKYRIRQLRKFSQDLTDESQYTMMSNHEFEVLFRSENRNDEVAFRLLYTPLAQEYMVKLLNDSTAGFGDDFSYAQNCCVTRVCSEHLNATDLGTPPFYSDDFDLREIKSFFLEYSAAFFRSFYFTLAPVMLIPAYNEPRNTPGSEETARTISPSEIEGAACYRSELFRSAESITENIFNVVSFTPFPGGADAVVESIGFAGVEHTEYVSCYGRDGRYHNVPVHWVEYVPVSRQTSLRAYLEESAPQDFKPLFRRRGILFG